MLINLLEILSGKKIPKYNRHPKVPAQKYENNHIAVNFVQSEGIKIVNIGETDITDGNLRIILGLIWTLILHYQIGADSGAKNELLQWVRSKIPSYNIQNFTKDWNDGRALCALNNALAPGTCSDHERLDPNQKVKNCQNGIDMAYNNLGIPKVMTAEDLANPRTDEHSVMTYISYFRNAQPKKQSLAEQTRAWGKGLVEGYVGEPAEFHVDSPGGKLEVRVEGPSSNATVNITPKGNGQYDVAYHPTEPGNYKVHVTIDGQHIPGSTFHVTVTEYESLGGEGKIRVFYSTTSSTEKGRSDVRNLEALLISKEVHKRPDFEPWIPVDIMEREDRFAVFKRAGTKNLPIIFIDDVYVGDYDTLVELEEKGQLNRLLNYNQRGAASAYSIMKSHRGGGGARSGSTPTATARSVPASAPAPAAAPAGGAKFCGQCGNQRQGAAKFCGQCGSKF